MLGWFQVAAYWPKLVLIFWFKADFLKGSPIGGTCTAEFSSNHNQRLGQANQGLQKFTGRRV